MQADELTGYSTLDLTTELGLHRSVIGRWIRYYGLKTECGFPGVGKKRFYTKADVDKIRKMNTLVLQGMNPAMAADICNHPEEEKPKTEPTKKTRPKRILKRKASFLERLRFFITGETK